MSDDGRGQDSVKRGDKAMRLKRFRIEELTRRIATVSAMAADADRKLADLDESVARERQRANDSDLGRLAFPSFVRSIEVRRENLRATLKELERERESVENALALATQELRALELAEDQQRKRIDELEARRAESRIEELAIVRHLRKHALRGA